MKDIEAKNSCCPIAPCTRHILLALGGVVLTGAGLSVLGDAISRRQTPNSRIGDWFWLGTLALALVNAGICLTIEASHQKRVED